MVNKRQKKHLDYIAGVVKKRMRELAMTKYFVYTNYQLTHPTLERIMNASDGYNLLSLLEVLDALDLEIKITKKKKDA